ncbi:MAG: hypothetical protein PVG07_02415 [Acidobacteriota bacterium]|jgi:tetratricopeptide (TPR) repeat protein
MNLTFNRRTHPDPEAIERFLSGDLPGPEDRSVEEHLRAGCVACLFKARELALTLTETSRRSLRKGLFGGANRDALLGSYGTWLERKVLLIELETGLAPELVSELMLRPPAARRETVRKSRRYQMLALAEALREESRREGFRDVARAVELAELAVEVADCLCTGFYGVGLVSDARALAYAMLGNAQRVAGDLFGADRQLRSAVELLRHGTGSPTERAEVLSLLASLRVDQSRFDAAIRLLDDVATVYRTQSLHREEGSALIQMARAAGAGGQPEQAVELLRYAVELLDPQRDQRLILWAQHNIAAFLDDADRSAEAREHLERIRPLYDHFPEDRSIHLRRRWLEGRIAAGVGETERAIAALQEVRSVFVEQEQAFDDALVTLDLAAVFLSEGRTEDVKRLAEEMYPIFRSQDVHRQALTALVLFKQAALTEAATVQLVRDVAEYLTRARRNPYLPFEPRGG